MHISCELQQQQGSRKGVHNCITSNDDDDEENQTKMHAYNDQNDDDKHDLITDGDT